MVSLPILQAPQMMVDHGHSRLLRYVLTGALLLVLAACVTPASETPYGVQAGHSSYVPARIAMLPCRVWPAGARFESLPLSNGPATDRTNLCTAFDAYILSSFNDQPYMKGFSTKFVLKALSEADHSDLPASIETTWGHRDGDCSECQTIPAFYNASLAKRPEWMSWLNTLSKAVHNADALLLPFVTYTSERRYDDRGLLVAERSAAVALLLVDTNNAELLWAGGREASVPHKELATTQHLQDLSLPSWNDLEARLFAEPLWREFPGRQVF